MGAEHKRIRLGAVSLMKRNNYKKELAARSKYLWIHMTNEEIFAYAPVFYNTMRDALDALHDDIRDIASRNHYTVSDVMVLSVEELEERVKEMWDNWEDDYGRN